MDATRPASTREAKIVAAFDGSRAGFDAVTLGRLLAETTGATLLVADVFPYNVLFGPSVTLDRAMETCLTRAAEQRVRQVEDALAGFDRWVHHMRAAIPAARALHALAEEEAAQMIVVGSSHRRGTGRVSPGTTAQDLLRDARIPVVLAPAGWRDRRPARIRTVGAAFDGSVGAAQALSAATTLARATGATLRAIAVFEPPHRTATSNGSGAIAGNARADLRQRLDEALAALPGSVEAEAEIIDGDPLELLALESSAVDILAVSPDGRGTAGAPLPGSAASGLVWLSRSPLLVVHGADHPLEGLADRLAAHAGSVEA